MKKLLLILMLGLAIVPNAMQADAPIWVNTTVEEFVVGGKNASDSIYFIVDSKKKESQKFVTEKLPEISQKLQKAYPTLKQFFVDARNKGHNSTIDKLFDTHAIIEYPSICLFMYGVKTLFDGPFAADTLVEKVGKRLGSFPLDLATMSALKQIPTGKLTIFYFTTVESLNILAKGLASRYYKLQFVKVQSKDLIDQIAKENGFKLEPWSETLFISRRHEDGYMKQFIPKKLPITINQLSRFIESAGRNLFADFGPATIQDIDSFMTITEGSLFYTCTRANSTKQLEILAKLPQKVQNKVMVRIVDENNQLGQEFLQSVGFPKQSPGVFMITKRYDGKYNKYIMSNSDKPTLSNLEDFAEDCMDGEHPKHYKSEEIPSTEMFKYVSTLVGKNIHEKVFKDKTHHHIIFVLDKYTKAVLPKFQLLAEKFRHEKVLFYTFDTDANENRHIKPQHEGTILFVSKRLHQKKSFQLDKSLSLSKFGAFLEEVVKKDNEVLELVRKSNFWQDL